jgi:uncharacterized protein YecE (DUF72 family)
VSRPGTPRIGVSGYDYPEWKGGFYPGRLPRSRWLGHAVRAFGSIELNGTFYSLKSPAAYRRWRASAPSADYLFAVKGSGFITHRLRLKDPKTALANFYASGVLALGRHTGPFLWQLPPRLRFDRERLERFLDLLPRDTAEASRLAARHDRRLPVRAQLKAPEPARYRHALEVRDASFCSPEAYEVLRAHDVALVVADTGGLYPQPDEPTADFIYVRLHGPRELYASGYTPDEIGGWAGRVERWLGEGKDVFAYFDNTARGHAPRDAAALQQAVARLGGHRAAAAEGRDDLGQPPGLDRLDHVGLEARGERA